MTATFSDLHRTGTFLLVNVHDAGTAVLAESTGAVALGTTSSGHAYTLARRDAIGALNRDEAVQRAAQICEAVDLPVSVDAENGWGHRPSDVAQTIRDLADIGAAGASIEDWSGDPDIGFYDRQLAKDRIEAAVETSASLPNPFVVCARADSYLHRTTNPSNEAITRLQSFAEAGADCLYAPGPRDLDTISRIVREAGGPVNALIPIGSPLTMADLETAGVRRVSVGGSLYRATMAIFQQIVHQVTTTGSFITDPPPIPGMDIEELFKHESQVKG